MKIGDLVISKGTTDGKIGTVKYLTEDLAQVYWLRDGDQTWCLQQQLLAVKKCP